MGREPTADECERRAVVAGCMAVWYPQMGGYCGKAWVVPTASGCFDVYVYHDGEFPLRGEHGNKPTRLHHCNAEQFIDFGETVAKFIESLDLTL